MVESQLAHQHRSCEQHGFDSPPRGACIGCGAGPLRWTGATRCCPDVACGLLGRLAGCASSPLGTRSRDRSLARSGPRRGGRQESQLARGGSSGAVMPYGTMFAPSFSQEFGLYFGGVAVTDDWIEQHIEITPSAQNFGFCVAPCAGWFLCNRIFERKLRWKCP